MERARVNDLSQQDFLQESYRTINDDEESELELERYCFLHRVKRFGPANKAIALECGDNYTLVLNGRYYT